MSANKKIHAAFVSTNSICQGQQVQPIWQPLFEEGISINFAHKSFIWNNEASDQAHVHVIIVGFSYEHASNCVLFDGEERQLVDNINGYLANAANVFVERRTKPICAIEPMVRGSQPTDNGNLLLNQEEYEELTKKEPQTKKWIRPFSMGEEFIKSIPRYCLWLVDVTPADLKEMPEVMERVRAVRDYRLQSKKAATRKKAEIPWRFDEVRPPKTCPYIGIPAVSSSSRKYIPCGFIKDNLIPGNKLYFISSDSLYIFGIFNSLVHNAWMRVVTGRLGMGYNYSNTIVYNNFPWPGVTNENKETPVEQCVPQEVRKKIEACAQEVLDAREFYINHAQEIGKKCSLADMYDPNNDIFYPKLTNAHKALDKSVEAAYGVNFNGNEEKIVAHLFSLYETLTS